MRGQGVALQPEHLREEDRVEEHQREACGDDGGSPRGDSQRRRPTAPTHAHHQRQRARAEDDPAAVPEQQRGPHRPQIASLEGPLREEVLVMREDVVAGVGLLPDEEPDQRRQRHRRQRRARPGRSVTKRATAPRVHQHAHADGGGREDARLFGPDGDHAEGRGDAEPPAGERQEREHRQGRQRHLGEHHVPDAHRQRRRGQDRRRRRPGGAPEEARPEQVGPREGQHGERQHHQVADDRSGAEEPKRHRGEQIEERRVPARVVVRKDTRRDVEAVLGHPLRAGHVHVGGIPEVRQRERARPDRGDPHGGQRDRDQRVAPSYPGAGPFGHGKGLPPSDPRGAFSRPIPAWRLTPSGGALGQVADPTAGQRETGP